MRKMKCTICEAPLKDFGHNPDPISKTGRCCDDCNFRFVIRARIIEMQSDV